MILGCQLNTRKLHGLYDSMLGIWEERERARENIAQQTGVA